MLKHSFENLRSAQNSNNYGKGYERDWKIMIPQPQFQQRFHESPTSIANMNTCDDLTDLDESCFLDEPFLWTSSGTISEDGDSHSVMNEAFGKSAIVPENVAVTPTTHSWRPQSPTDQCYQSPQQILRSKLHQRYLHEFGMMKS